MRNVIMSDIADEYDASDMSGGAPQDDVADTPADVTTTKVVPSGDDAPVEETTADAVADNVPMAQTMRARAAVFEAILDEVVEDSITDPEPGQEPPTREEATNTISEITDEAVEQGVVSPNFRSRIPFIIQRHFGMSAPRVRLYAKAAKFASAALTEVKENTISVDTVADDGLERGDETISAVLPDDGELNYLDSNAEKASGPGMFIPGIGFMSDDEVKMDDISEEQVTQDMTEGEDAPHISDVTLTPEDTPIPDSATGDVMRWSFNDDDAPAPADEPAEDSDEEDDEKLPAEVEKEVVDPATDVEAKDVGDAKTEASMKFLAASIINERKATVLVSRRYTSSVLRRVSHELRHILPRNFVRKYNIK